MLDINSLINQKDNNQQDDWRKVLELSRQSLSQKVISDRTFELVALASSGPEQFTLISKMFYKYGKTHPNVGNAAEQLLKNVDNSKFSLPEWLGAIEVFYLWLKKEERNTEFINMLGYLQCCGESPENKDLKQDFIFLVEDMLSTYGYNG